MRSSKFILIFLVSIVLAGSLFYFHTSQNPDKRTVQSIRIEPGGSGHNNIIVAGGGKLGDVDNVSVEVKYEVIGDPKTVSIAREFIRLHLPVPAASSNEPPVDWVNTGISVLKVVVELSNNNSIPVYYETNAFCGTFHWSSNSSNRTIFDWRVSYPVAVPEITAYNGAVFTVPTICTLDLAYAKIPPRSTIVNEYYFIITKPFQGEIKASATVCLKPFSNTCRVLGGTVPVTVTNNN